MWYGFQNKPWAKVIGLIVIALMIQASVTVRYAKSTCVFDSLSNIPLDAKVGASPGIIMFLLDDSGSMDWTLLLDGVDYAPESGLFDKDGDGYRDYYYVYSLGSHKMFWKTQWHVVNKLYYNPASTYTPWPGQSNADPDNPENPYFTSDDINLDGVFYDFSDIDFSEIEDAQGAVIIDNTDVLETDEFIVDDGDPGFSSFENNDVPKAWPHRDSGNANEGDYVRIYDYEGDLPFRAVHSFNLADEGEYEVFVRWIKWDSDGGRGDINYTVYYEAGTDDHTIDQSGSNGSSSGWVSLGIYDFEAGDGNAKVSVAFDGTGGTSVSTDAVKLVPQFTVGTPDKLFQCQSTGNAWEPYDSEDAYLGDYVYTHAAGDYTATWTANTLDPAKNYNVYVRWHVGSYRSDSVQYSVVHDGGTATKYFNQQENSDEWTELVSNASFSSGTGTVTLTHTTPGADEDRASADAVAFVPSDEVTTSDIDIANSHYYVKGTDNEIYLVNFANNEFEYYKVDHTLGTDTDESVTPGGDVDEIVDQELIEITPALAATAGIVTPRTYVQERQNFANWFAFYRKRQYTAKNAVGRVIDDMSGVRIGMLGINNTIEQEALPINVTLDNTTYDRTNDLLSILYAHDPIDNTPLRSGLKRIGEYFEGNDDMNDETDDLAAYISETSEPFFTEDDGGACGQAFCILMTDGYYNGSLSGIGNADVGDTASGDLNDTDFDGGKFADNQSNKLADVAMHYYERDLNTSLSNSVPTTNLDQADHQHMITFSVSFGVTGEINTNNYQDCPIGICPPEWWVTDGDSDKMKIDDLFHAAVNGRGDYINAGTPEELISAMDELKSQITSRLGSAAAAATNSIQMRSGTKIYQGTYYSDKWSGELVQYSVNTDTGAIGDVDWSASDKLDGNPDASPAISEKTYDQRVIFTYNGTAGIPFQSGQTGIPYSSDLVNYLRGDDSNNAANGGTYRVRAGKLGDIVHSAPVVYGDTIFVGANDGMLHAFNRADGVEKFAYILKLFIDNGTLPSLASSAYTHLFYVDNSVNVRTISSSLALLTGGLRKGGKGYFCLNVDDSAFASASSPAETDAGNVVKWEYSYASGVYGVDDDGDGMVDESDSDGIDNDNDGEIDEADEAADEDPDLGYSYSRAYIVDTNSTDVGWIVIFGNGYDSTNEHSVLYLIDINDTTGAIDASYFTNGVKKIDTGVGSCNGMSSPAIVDVNSDGKVDYVYAGDMKGNLWKFDLSSTNYSDWGSAYMNESVPKPLITVKNAQGGQPITVEPNVMKMECDPGQKGYLVVFGTGQYIGTNDPSNTDQQTFYGVWDWQDEFISPVPDHFPAPQTSASKAMYLGEINISDTTPLLSPSTANADSLTLLKQSIAESNGSEMIIDGYRIMTDYTINWFSPTAGDTDTVVDHAGWYFNLPDARARVIQDPLLRSGSGSDVGITTFISSQPSESDCGGSAGSSWLYQVSTCNGGMTDEAQFDTNDDNEVNEDDKLDDNTSDENPPDKSPSGKEFDDMLYKPIQVGPYLYINDSSGSPPNQILIPPNMEGIFYWRMIEG